MKKRFSYCLAMLFSVFTCSTIAQTIYHFEYEFPQSTERSQYDALFIQYSNGSGFVRVKQIIPGSTDSSLVEFKFQEQFYADNAGNVDTNKIFYQASDPTVIAGKNIKLLVPVFWFTRSNTDQFFEPSDISMATDLPAINKATILKKEFIQATDLKKKFVLQYFTENEDIYKNLFAARARGLSSFDKNTRIYLLIVANTNDSAIGNSCFKDMNRMLHTFQDMADYLDIKFYPTTIYGKIYNKANIEQAIKDIDPSENDIMIFYYSGHGFRKENKPRQTKPYSRYPFLDFRAKPEDDYNFYSLNLEDIFLTLNKKRSRFTLVLGDCCNNIPGSPNAIGTPIPEKRGSGLDWNDDNIKSLFFNPNKMSVIATAADIGQKASSNDKFGGFFSYFFKTAMETHFSVLKKDVTWEQVLQDAQSQTVFKAQHTYCSKPYVAENICNQVPFYKKVEVAK